MALMLYILNEVSFTHRSYDLEMRWANQVDRTIMTRDRLIGNMG